MSAMIDFSEDNYADSPIKKRGEGPDDIDLLVGQRLRTARQMRALSQEKLATAVGITFQQLQKYERGHNRVSASKLWHFSILLNVPITYFFPDQEQDSIDNQATGLEQTRFALEVMKSLSTLPVNVQNSVHVLLRAMAEAEFAKD